MKSWVLLFLSIPLCAQLPPSAAIPADKVVARIDGRDVTAGEIRALLAGLPPDFIQRFNQNPKAALQQLYMMRYLASEGEKAKLAEQSPLKEQLEIQRENQVAAAMLNYEQDHYAPPDEAVRDSYNRNQARYQQARVKVIFIAFKPVPVTSGVSPEEAARIAIEAARSTVQRTETEARVRANEVLEKARAGADFAKLAAEYSDDVASKAAGGDFGLVSGTSSHSDDLKRAVLALQNGQLSEPIRQFNGFYLIRVEEKSVQPLTAVQGFIIQDLRSAHLKEWLDGVTRRFDPAIQSVEFFTQPSLAVPK